MKDICKLFLALAYAGAAPACFAESANVLTLHTDLPDVGLSAIRALAALAVVLAIFFGGVWLVRNGQRLSWRRTGPPRLAILETRALGNRFALYVVGYEQQRLLIGSSPTGLNLLSALPPAPSEIAEARLPVPAETAQSKLPAPVASFAQCLQQVLQPK